MSSQSQRCKVTFEKGSAIPTRHYLLVGPEASRFEEVWNKVLAEYRNPNFDQGKSLAALYWIDSETDEVIVDSQDAYESALAYIVPDHTGISYLKLFAKTRSKDGWEGRSSVSDRQRRPTTANRTHHSFVHHLLLEQLRRTTTRVTTGRKAPTTDPESQTRSTPLPCGECGEMMYSRAALNAHMAGHSEDVSKVSSVGKTVKRRRRQAGGKRLKTEDGVEIDHTQDKEGAEDGGSAEVASNVSEEEEEHAENGMTSQVGATSQVGGRVGGRGPFACTKCERVFSKARQLRGHQTAHSLLRQQSRTLSPQKNLHFHGAFPFALVHDEGHPLNGTRHDGEGEGEEEGAVRSTNQMGEDDGVEEGRESLDSPLKKESVQDGVKGIVEDMPKTGPFQCGKCPRVFDAIRQLRGHQAAHTPSLKRKRQRFHLNLQTNKRPETSVMNLKKKRRRSSQGQLRTLVTPQSLPADLSTNGRNDLHSPVKSGVVGVARDGVMDGHFTCPKCDRLFMTKRQLQGHQAFHSEKGKFACSLCHRGFRTREVLETHQDECQGLDPGTIPQAQFSCVPACGKLFHQNKTLKQHRALCGHYRESASDDVDDITASEGLKNGGESEEAAREDSVEVPEKAITPVPFADAESATVTTLKMPTVIATAPKVDRGVEGVEGVGGVEGDEEVSLVRHTGLREKTEEVSKKNKSEDMTGAALAADAGNMPKFFIAL